MHIESRKAIKTYRLGRDGISDAVFFESYYHKEDIWYLYLIYNVIIFLCLYAFIHGILSVEVLKYLRDKKNQFFFRIKMNFYFLKSTLYYNCRDVRYIHRYIIIK